MNLRSADIVVENRSEMSLLLGMLPLVASLTMPSMERRLVEVTPAKGAMLMKVWQGRAESMSMLKTVPDGKTGKKLKVISALAGEEAVRRKQCANGFQLFRDRALALADADSGDYPEALRQAAPALKIAGMPCGPNAKLFANLGTGPSTLSIVQCTPGEWWSIFSLCVSPDTRDISSIIEAEVATLAELRALCNADGATLRVLSDVTASLAATRQRLGLSDMSDARSVWLCAEDEPSIA